MLGVGEVKVDIDLDKQNPCNVGYRLFKIKSFAESHGYPAFYYLTPNGIHVRLIMPELGKWEELALRAYLNDDFDRWRLDETRIAVNSADWSILFTWRIKRYRKKGRVGVEVPVGFWELLTYVEMLCMDFHRRFLKQGD